MRKVSYLYNQEFTKFILSQDHPMKPMRLKMVHSLINNYNLTESLDMYYSKLATPQELCYFHHPQYIKYLETWVNPKTTKIVENVSLSQDDFRSIFFQDIKLGEVFKINRSFDCPGFEGLFNYCQLSGGSSIDAAHMILGGIGDIVINWMGGFHHAKKANASGFCFINDIVLCILELLKVHQRVLYLDIDVHHGDGVEEAFFSTNRVMTVSFHQYEEGFFPQTGGIDDVGVGEGKYYSVNIPLKKGIDNMSYINLFKRVMQRVMQSYRPNVLVIQCGADSLSKDKLGDLNLSIKGHGECVNFMKSFAVPLILLGGGGYTIQNVARCWAYETGLMMNQEIENKIPSNNEFYYFYSKDGNVIHFQIDKRSNTNTNAYLDQIYQRVAENLRMSDQRPSVPFHFGPQNYYVIDDDSEEQEESIEIMEKMCEQKKQKYFGRN